MTSPARVAKTFSLVSLLVDSSAFMTRSRFISSHAAFEVSRGGSKGRLSDIPLRPSLSERSSRETSHLQFAMKKEIEAEEAAHFNVKNAAVKTGDDGDSLKAAFGAGQGKHAGKRRRRHTNKYSTKSKAAEIDPWEQQLRKAEETMGQAETRRKSEVKEMEARRIQRRIERGEIEYPDEEDIDPYDPSTFGYIEVGQIQGAHGIKGEVRVRSSTDFAMKRLCTPGVKFIKAPNRRFPRDVELIGGRWQKEDIFLMHFEGIGTRDCASALRGHKVYVLEDDEVHLEENEYMVRDLVGARAYRVDDKSTYIGEIVGVVLGDDISSTAGLASDLLELRLASENPGDIPKICYVPFVPAIIPVVTIDRDTGTSSVLMDLPDGLLDLAVEMEDNVAIKGFLPGPSSSRK